MVKPISAGKKREQKHLPGRSGCKPQGRTCKGPLPSKMMAESKGQTGPSLKSRYRRECLRRSICMKAVVEISNYGLTKGAGAIPPLLLYCATFGSLVRVGRLGLLKQGRLIHRWAAGLTQMEGGAETTGTVRAAWEGTGMGTGIPHTKARSSQSFLQGAEDLHGKRSRDSVFSASGLDRP